MEELRQGWRGAGSSEDLVDDDTAATAAATINGSVAKDHGNGADNTDGKLYDVDESSSDGDGASDGDGDGAGDDSDQASYFLASTTSGTSHGTPSAAGEYLDSAGLKRASAVSGTSAAGEYLDSIQTPTGTAAPMDIGEMADVNITKEGQSKILCNQESARGH